MKRFALLRLQHGANKVVFDCHAPDLAAAVKTFNRSFTGGKLDADGYEKIGDVTYCVAEYWDPFHTLP